MFVLTISSIAQKTTDKHFEIVAGKITEKLPASVAPKTETVYTTYNGVTFYKGSKGGIYYYRLSKKTGKPYRCYIK